MQRLEMEMRTTMTPEPAPTAYDAYGPSPSPAAPASPPQQEQQLSAPPAHYNNSRDDPNPNPNPTNANTPRGTYYASVMARKGGRGVDPLLDLNNPYKQPKLRPPSKPTVGTEIPVAGSFRDPVAGFFDGRVCYGTPYRAAFPCTLRVRARREAR